MDVTFDQAKQELVIRLPVNKDRPLSSTGKTRQVCTTHGNTPTNVIIDGKPVMVGVNAFISAK